VPGAAELGFIARLYQQELEQTVATHAIGASVESNRDFVYIALLDDEPCGFVQAVWSGGPYELLGICVGTEFRRRGVGLRLLDRLLTGLHTLNACELWLEVRAGNLKAQNLYLKTGATQTGLRKRYYADGTDAVLMSYCFASDS
jgi:ribosomal protein S18 acetylase RimI-like enzyme